MEFVLLVLLLSLVFCISAVAVFRRRAWASAVVHDGQQPIIEIRDRNIARRALMDHADAFCNRPLNIFPVALVSGRRRRHSDNLTSVPYGPRWRALRCTLNAAVLHPSRLGHMDPLRLEAMDALVADLRVRCGDGGGREIVVRDILNAAVFPLVARTCFGSGVDDGHVRAMRDLLRAFVLSVDGAKDFAGSKMAKLLHWRQWRRFLAFRGKQAELFLPLINARRNAANRQLTLSGGLTPYLDLLLDVRVPVDDKDDDIASGKALRPLTDDELVSLVSEFLGAGPGTVVSSMEWTLAHLVLQPEVQENIRREVDAVEGALSEAHVRQMPYMRAVVLESLRLHPPIPFALRDVPDQAGADVVGCPAATVTVVPTEGARAHFNLGEIGRDKNAWTDPNVFRPERFLVGGRGEGVGLVPGPKEIKMMPFGAGRRACPGGGLATMHVKSFVATLVREFEWAPPSGSGGGAIDLTELDGFFKVMKTRSGRLSHCGGNAASCVV